MPKLLLDTHIWLWWFLSPEQINKKSFRAIENPDNHIYLSVASCWEIAIKEKLGKLKREFPLRPDGIYWVTI